MKLYLGKYLFSLILVQGQYKIYGNHFKLSQIYLRIDITNVCSKQKINKNKINFVKKIWLPHPIHDPKHKIHSEKVT